MKKEKRYVLHFEGLGYYAARQPNYEWSFTKDINLAKFYKTTKGIIDRASHGAQLVDFQGKKIDMLTVKLKPVEVSDIIDKKDTAPMIKEQEEKARNKKFAGDSLEDIVFDLS